MQQRETYIYEGVEYTLGELSRISNLRRETIQIRLKKGLSVADALRIPPGKLPRLDPSDIGKQVPVVFITPVPEVKREMQPVLGKEYLATIHGNPKRSCLCRVFYTIELDNGKKLITYPGEFEIKRKP